MAKKAEKTTQFKCDANKLIAVLTSPQFQIDREKGQGALEASVRDQGRNAQRYQYEVHTVEYAKGITGLDKSKTEKAVATYDWNLTDRTCSWKYVPSNSFADRVKVWGSMEITETGSGVTLHSEFNIEVKIPLIGGKAESMVIAEAEKGMNTHDDIVRKHLG